MAHIVFIVGSYHPDFQAVGVCVRNVVKELKNNHIVKIISQKKNFDQKNKEKFEGVEINRVQTNITGYKFKLEKALNKRSKILNILSSFSNYLSRLINFSKFFLSKVILQNDIVEAYLNELVKIDQQKKIDMIIPCVSPFESCIAAVKFKLGNQVKVVPYMFDNYASNINIYRNIKLLQWIKFNNHVKLERFIFRNSDKVICMKHYFESFSKIHKRDNNIIVAEHPLLIKSKRNNKFNFDKNKINIVYTGGLFKRIRNPEYALSIIEFLMKKNSKINVHIFGSGNCRSIIKKFTKKNPKKIFYHGHVDLKLAEAARQGCDYLLSIGNINNNQLPSKTFEYMSTLKPIIHFSKNKFDKTNNILSKYPNKCILFEESNKFFINHQILSKFFLKKNNPISFNDLKEIFYDADPLYTSSIINKILQNNYNAN